MSKTVLFFQDRKFHTEQRIFSRAKNQGRAYQPLLRRKCDSPENKRLFIISPLKEKLTMAIQTGEKGTIDFMLLAASPSEDYVGVPLFH